MIASDLEAGVHPMMQTDTLPPVPFLNQVRDVVVVAESCRRMSPSLIQ